jgi:hypothetical protein
MTLDGELQVPEHAYGDPKSVEILRAWAADGARHASLRLGVPGWDDPGVWGILLVDLARHFASGYSQSLGVDPEDVLDQICDELEIQFERLLP